MKKSISVLLCLATALSLLSGALFTLAPAAQDMGEWEQRNVLHNGDSPMDAEPQVITLKSGGTPAENGNYSLSLDGTWKLTFASKAVKSVNEIDWQSAIDAEVPGSIYTAMTAAGKITDPYLGKSMIDANKLSSKHWYYTRTFTYGGKGERVRLNFDGLCNVADIYLNGKLIASHEGMFGGPYVDVTDTVKKGENTLVVYLAPAKDYTATVVFNCSYGWHYAKLYPLGIWQSVTVTDVPAVEFDSPFISTVDAQKGTVDMSIELVNRSGKSVGGTLTGVISPKNFEGRSCSFELAVKSVPSGGTTVRLRADIPDPHLWWPGGYGDQNLYTLSVSFKTSDGATDVCATDFGIRQLEYAPFPGAENNGMYNRTIVINGTPVYMKGAGWCTIDAQMRFSREDYDRILSRTAAAGINFLRAWGGGLVETEEFYDLCDEYGICVYQEWPMCWDSTKSQPAEVLYETVRLNTKRLRNRASLIVWGGGNEGEAPYTDTVLNNVGKMTYELDGTRAFWRQDGGVASAGISHDHIHWSGLSPEHYITDYYDVYYRNFHEYGLDSMMNMDSIAKYATAEEMAAWPIDSRGTVAYHTATFNGMNNWTPTPYGYDIDTFIHYANMFVKTVSLEDMVVGSQLAQAVADYLPAQNSRMKYPYNTTNTVYKLNDVAPHGTWAIIDWYGAPKIAYYLMQDAYRTLMAAPMLERYNTVGPDGSSVALDMPIYLLDDVDTLASGADWNVTVTAYDEGLGVIKEEKYDGKGSVGGLMQVGTFHLSESQTAHTPMILVVDLTVGGAAPIRSYAYFNFEAKQGSLFYLPRTNLSYSISGQTVTVKNTGNLPAVSVYFDVKDTAEFICSDDYFMLKPDESVDIQVNDASLINTVTCFNIANAADRVPPTVPADTALVNVTHDGATLVWTASTDDDLLYGYNMYLNGELFGFAFASETSYTFTGLSEATKYHVTLEAVDSNGNKSGLARGYTFTTDVDRNAPTIISTHINDGGTDKATDVVVTFDAEIVREDAENVSLWAVNNGARVEKAVLNPDKKSVTLTVSGIRNGEAYTLGVVGLSDTKYLHNRMPYTETVLDSSLYLTVSFDGNEGGVSYTAGREIKRVDLTGAAELTGQGVLGQALACNGNGGAIVRDIAFNMGDAATVTFWYNGNASASGYNVLFAKGPKEAGHFEVYAKDGNLCFYAPEIGDISLGVSMKGGAGWHKFALVYENNTLTVWIDGEKRSSVAARGRISDTVSDFAVGCLCDGSLIYAGLLDDVRLYSRVLTDAELTVLEGHENRTVDVTGNSCGKSVSTDITLSDGEGINLWFNPDGFEGFNILFAKDRKESAKHFELYTESGKLCLYAPTEESGVAINFMIDLSDYRGDWHMLTLINRDGTIYIYIDGEMAACRPASFKAGAGSSKMYIGKLVEGGFDFNGKITGVEIIKQGMTDEEITAEYNKHVTVETGTDTGFSLGKTVLYAKPGDTVDLNLTAKQGGPDPVFTLSDNTVAGLDAATGKVTALQNGLCVIRIDAREGGQLGLVAIIVSDNTETVVMPDTTPVADPEPQTQPDTEPDTDTDVDTTTGPDADTPTGDESGTSDAVVTDDAGTDTQTPGMSDGCGSAVSLVCAVTVLLALGLTAVPRRKKER